MKDFKATIAKPRKIALYTHLEIDDFVCVQEVRYADYDKHFTPLPIGERREMSMEGWARISKPVDATFTSVESDEIVRNAVAAIDEQEQKLRSELGVKLAQLQDRRNQLLALTHDVPDVLP